MLTTHELLINLRNAAYDAACRNIENDIPVRRLATEIGEHLYLWSAPMPCAYELAADGDDLDALAKALGHEPTWREGLAFQRCVTAALWIARIDATKATA